MLNPLKFNLFYECHALDEQRELMVQVVVRDVEATMLVLDQFLVVRKFPNVVPEELRGMPFDREVKFCIILVLGVQPISILSYHLALAEL